MVMCQNSFWLSFFYRATEQHNKDKAGYSIGDRDEYGSTVWLIALDLTSKEHRVAMRPLDSCPFSSLNLYLWNCFRHLKGLSRWHYNIWMELRVFRRHSVLFSPPGHSLDILDASDVLYMLNSWDLTLSWRSFLIPLHLSDVVRWLLWSTSQKLPGNNCQGLSSTGGILRSSKITVPIPLLAEWKVLPQCKQ